MKDTNIQLVNAIGRIDRLSEEQKRRAGIAAARYCLDVDQTELLPTFLSQLGLDQ